MEFEDFVHKKTEEYVELLKPFHEETTMENIMGKVHADIYTHILMFGQITNIEVERICNNRIKQLPDRNGADALFTKEFVERKCVAHQLNMQLENKS